MCILQLQSHTVQLKIFAKQKFRPTQLPLHCGNVQWNEFLSIEPMVIFVVKVTIGSTLSLTQDKKKLRDYHRIKKKIAG